VGSGIVNYRRVHYIKHTRRTLLNIFFVLIDVIKAVQSNSINENIIKNMTNKSYAEANGGVKPVRVWVDGCFDMMYDNFFSLGNFTSFSHHFC